MSENINNIVADVEKKIIDPGKNIGNYVIQIVAEDGRTILKQVLALKSTIRIGTLEDQSLATEIR